VVEQARAVADVQAAAQMARMFPRDTSVAVEAMEESCRQVELADRAFFSYPRAGQTVVGGSVHLARELARCWGHMDYGVKELSRGESESEMLAFAWDLQTNARAETTFIVPHGRSWARGGAAGGAAAYRARPGYLTPAATWMFRRDWATAFPTTLLLQLDRYARSNPQYMTTQRPPTESEPPYEAVSTTSAALPAVPLSIRVVLTIRELNILIRVPNARTQFQF